MIIGGGAGGTALLPILSGYKEITVTGIADIHADAPALKLARDMGIATGNDFQDLLARVDADIIINTSGDKTISQVLVDPRRAGIEVIEGASAALLFKLVDERRAREELVLSRLKEQEALYNIGLMLTSSESEDELMNTILDCAIQLTHSPAGSIALYEESEACMKLVTMQGFSQDFTKKIKWEIRPGGLTEYILNQHAPVVINDVNELGAVDNAQIEAEGIQALIAMPLISEHETIGILYVDDFSPRDFTPQEESFLALLSTQAAIAIEKMQLFEKIKKLAMTDGLTGLYNHRYFVNMLNNELERARRYDHPLSLMIIDVDHFKNYNDTNGHLKGNEVLQGVTKSMKRNLRSIDLLARYGGEEFAVILPKTDPQQALESAWRMCRAVEQEHFPGEEKQPLQKLTISVGVASFPDDADRESLLLECADKALYEAKQAGRNRAHNYAP